MVPVVFLVFPDVSSCISGAFLVFPGVILVYFCCFLVFPGVFLVLPGVFLARTKGSRGTELCVMVYVILVDGRDSARIALMVCLRRQVLISQCKVGCVGGVASSPVAMN